MISSEIQEEQVISGTDASLDEAAKKGIAELSPAFVLVTAGPCASMIGTDLEGAAERIQSSYQIPAAALKLDGMKDYTYGMSLTLEAMGKLLLSPAKKIRGSVNILGANSLDMEPSDYAAIKEWLEAKGYQVVSTWGMQAKATELAKAAAAEVNLVVNACGMRLARYMEEEFGIPYIVGAPYGRSEQERILTCLKEKKTSGTFPEEGSVTCDTNEADNGKVVSGKRCLIVAEQFKAEALRQTLLAAGATEAAVFSFSEMDKSSKQAMDAKLIGEDDLKNRIDAFAPDLVFADPLYQAFAGESDQGKWIALSNPATFSKGTSQAPEQWFGPKLDQWLANLNGPGAANADGYR